MIAIKGKHLLIKCEAVKLIPRETKPLRHLTIVPLADRDGHRLAPEEVASRLV